MWRSSIATAICRPTCWWWTGSITRRWGSSTFDPKFWPDPAGMNRSCTRWALRRDQRLAALCAADRYYDDLLKKGCLISYADGTRFDGLRRSSRIGYRHHQPEAAKWYWKTLHEDIISRASTRSGPMRPSPTCLPTALTSRWSGHPVLQRLPALPH